MLIPKSKFFKNSPSFLRSPNFLAWHMRMFFISPASLLLSYLFYFALYTLTLVNHFMISRVQQSLLPKCLCVCSNLFETVLYPGFIVWLMTVPSGMQPVLVAFEPGRPECETWLSHLLTSLSLILFVKGGEWYQPIN